MAVDQNAVHAAADVLQALLQRAAEEQQAYFHRFPDGNVSLELEWIDLKQLTRAAIAAYLALARDTSVDEGGPKALSV
jgi:hypothetical protein